MSRFSDRKRICVWSGRFAHCGLLCLLIGCGSSSEPPTHVTPEQAPSDEHEAAASAAATSRIPRCGAPETPELTSYLTATAGDGVTRHVEVVQDERNGVWMPDSHIAMPMHHATALRWSNLSDLSLLATAEGERLRFEFLLLTRNTRQVPDERAWRTEYSAEVSSVCVVSNDKSRAIGVHVPDVYTPQNECEELENAVQASVQALVRCTADTDCAVRDAPACELRGLGCYWVAVRRDADLAPINAAIRAYENSGCPTSNCDCASPPRTARCVDNICVAP